MDHSASLLVLDVELDGLKGRKTSSMVFLKRECSFLVQNTGSKLKILLAVVLRALVALLRN